MKKEMRSAAQRMLSRAQELGLTTKTGTAPVIDLMEELLAAKDGYRNAHAYRVALSKREAPVLEQEHPDESGSDFKLVSGRGCWVSMGQFSVHPYLTDEGIVVDVYPKGAEVDSIASTYAHTSEAEEVLAVEAERTAEILQAQKAALEDIGYDICEDSDQRSLWLWRAPTDGCDASFRTEAEAVEDAWSDAESQVLAVNDISTDAWNRLSLEEKVALVRKLGEDI